MFALLLGLVMLPTQAQTPAQALVTRQQSRPIVIAHRGASADAPENTLAAYRLAVERGSVIAETDVHLSQDGVVIVMHDSTVDRTTESTGEISGLASSAILGMHAGRWFSDGYADEPVPSLDMLLDAVGKDLVLCIEIKAGNGIVEAIQRSVEERGLMGRVIVFSFDPEQVRATRTLMPEVPALLLVRPTVPFGYDATHLVRMAREVGAHLVGLNQRAVNGRVVQTLQAAALPVFVYTVDHPADIVRMVEAGVDGIISNRPKATLDSVNRLRP